jgi:Glycosyltransferase family 87
LKSERARAAVRFWLPYTWSVETLNHAAVVGGALIVAHVAKAVSDLRASEVDFAIFYWSSRGWLAGRPLYEVAGGLPNYNPPEFHLPILLLAPLPLPAAFAIWTAISAAAAVVTIRVASREAGEPWSLQERRLLLAAVLIAAGVGATVHLGQVSWLIASIVTLGWRDARRGRWVAAGIWLGVAAALKPFLILVVVLFAVWRRWSALAAAAASAAACAALGLLVFGASASFEWLRLLAVTAPDTQVAYFINGSIAAPLARIGLGPAVERTACLIVAILTIVRARQLQIDRAFLIALIGSLFASPLGWIYYTPILAGPLIVAAKNRMLSRSAWWAWPLLACPAIGRHFLQSNRALALTAGSLYTWGFAILWLAAYGKQDGMTSAGFFNAGRSPRTPTNDNAVAASIR